jgi:putative Mg2+ transporter-C (MgtC) family protein
MELRAITLLSIGIRICAALLVGGILGLEREKKRRAAGLRTYMLVCVGSCLIMLTNQYIFQITGAGDPMRLGAQVISGIGFLGAGTIIVTKRSHIKGLTTAAGLWSAAAVGLALGIGFYEAAAIAGISIYFIMTVLQHWDARMQRGAKYMDIYLECMGDLSLGTLLYRIRQLDLTIDEIDTPPAMDGEERRAVIVSVALPKRMLHAPLLRQIEEIDGVLYAKEI